MTDELENSNVGPAFYITGFIALCIIGALIYVLLDSTPINTRDAAELKKEQHDSQSQRLPILPAPDVLIIDNDDSRATVAEQETEAARKLTPENEYLRELLAQIDNYSSPEKDCWVRARDQAFSEGVTLETITSEDYQSIRKRAQQLMSSSYGQSSEDTSEQTAQSTTPQVEESRFPLFLLLFCLLVYFLPSVVAYARDHTNSDSILIVNLFLGWTFLGWVVALAWAFSSGGRKTS